MFIRLQGEFTFGVVGAVDYVIGIEFVKRFIRRLSFQLGSANFLKDTPGVSNVILNNLHGPSWGLSGETFPGETFTSGDTLTVLTSHVVEFSDPNSINGDNSALIPSLYPDAQLNIELTDFVELTTAGDWDYTFAGRLEVVIEQETSLKVMPNALLKAFTQTTDIVTTGFLPVDLPTNALISEMLVVPLVDGAPNTDAIDYNAAFQIDIESGQTILDDRSFVGAQAMGFYDTEANYPLGSLLGGNAFPPPYLYYNLDHYHDGKGMFDNRQVRKWQLIVPAIYDPLTVNQVMIHFISKTPIRR